MKKKIFILFILFSITAQNPINAKDWGLGFEKKEAQPVGNESQSYLKEFDAYFVGDNNKKKVYLTFDAGYENGYTEKMLDILKEYKVKAAFFLVGTYIKENPEIVRRMVKEGHLVGNHTIRHKDMSKVYDIESFKEQLEKAEEEYYNVVGKEMKKYYRPPEGKYSEQSLKFAKELGYKTMFWSVAYKDYDINNQPANSHALDKLTERVHPGAIILLHNISKTNAEILGEMIVKYREMGYEFEPLEEFN
ncbi:MAG: polysaccharide deacetylase family protein [Clostridiales bacterium]|jgi:peptidoglycan-N-acetylmuramic acid deacetylase|nr:polysaccharide deacetylase family protein [Clostridiales bacterium]